MAYINEVRPVATSPDLSRHVATDTAGKSKNENRGTEDDEAARPPTTSGDLSRPVAAEGRVIELLESENKFPREQITVKDRQIADQLERAHEMNSLVGGLQRMLGPLLTWPDNPRREDIPDRGAIRDPRG
jgi:hypothetical protein